MNTLNGFMGIIMAAVTGIVVLSFGGFMIRYFMEEGYFKLAKVMKVCLGIFGLACIGLAVFCAWRAKIPILPIIIH